MEKLTTTKLAALLKDAEKAHGEYEKTLGKRDENWPFWYAKFIMKSLEGQEEK